MKYFYRTLGAAISIFSLIALLIFGDTLSIDVDNKLLTNKGTVRSVKLTDGDLLIILDKKDGSLVYPRWNGNVRDLSEKMSSVIGSEIHFDAFLDDDGRKNILSIKSDDVIVVPLKATVEHREMLLSSAKKICFILVVIGVLGGLLGDWLNSKQDKV